MDDIVHIPAYFTFVAPDHHIFHLVDHHWNLDLYYVGDGNGDFVVYLVGLAEFLGICYFGLGNQALEMSYFAYYTFFIFFQGRNPVFFCWVAARALLDGKGVEVAVESTVVPLQVVLLKFGLQNIPGLSQPRRILLHPLLNSLDQIGDIVDNGDFVAVVGVERGGVDGDRLVALFSLVEGRLELAVVD